MSATPEVLNPAPVAPAPAGLQHTLRELVQELNRIEKDKSPEGLYRQIVRQGEKSGLPVEEYQDCLLAAGLEASRASELARILDHATAVECFLHPQHPWSFRAALRLARGGSRRRAKTEAERLGERAEELVAVASVAGAGTFECGLFRLRFLPGATTPEVPAPAAATEAAAEEHVGIPLAPVTEEKLARLARRNGISRAVAAVELLQRAPWAQLQAAIPAAATAKAPEVPFEREAAPDPVPLPQPAPAPATFPLLRCKSAPPFPLLRRKNAPAFSLHRRKNPGRTPADVCRLAVKLPAALAARLTELGNACGLSRPEIRYLAARTGSGGPGARGAVRAGPDAPGSERKPFYNPGR